MQRDVHVPAVCPDPQAGRGRLRDRAKVVGVLQGIGVVSYISILTYSSVHFDNLGMLHH